MVALGLGGCLVPNGDFVATAGSGETADYGTHTDGGSSSGGTGSGSGDVETQGAGTTGGSDTGNCTDPGGLIILDTPTFENQVVHAGVMANSGAVRYVVFLPTAVASVGAEGSPMAIAAVSADGVAPLEVCMQVRCEEFPESMDAVDCPPTDNVEPGELGVECCAPGQIDVRYGCAWPEGTTPPASTPAWIIVSGAPACTEHTIRVGLVE